MAKSVADTLFAIDKLLDQRIDVLGVAFADAATSQATKWFRLAARHVSSLPTADGRLQLRGAAAAGKLAVTLDDAGDFTRFVTKALDQFADVSTIAFRGLKAAGHSTALTPEAKGALGAYRTLKLAEFGDLRDQIFGRMVAATRKAAASGQDAGELIVELREITDEWPWRARTLYESSIAEFSQVVTAVKAGNAPDRAYLYTGPIDLRIRPFCLHLVGRVLTRAVIDKLDNGQTPNSFLTRGGYNCRHQWRDVTNVPELAALANTGKRATPGIAALVASVSRSPRIRGRRTA